jgi:NADH:quinone reductase (non-electrogenic)
MTASRPRVLIVGGGFGGLQATLHLASLPIDACLVDRRNFHLFQPLTYQVATGALASAEIVYPLRQITRRHGNVRVALAEVTDFDLDNRRVNMVATSGTPVHLSMPYDLLVVAGGSQYSYFGHDEWRQWAPSPKTLEDAVEIRRRLLGAFEAAELEPCAARQREWLTFVVVGAGPTGVEMAGQIAELTRDMRRDFRSVDMRQVSIVLLEAGDRVLASFTPPLAARASRALGRLGVAVRLGSIVVDITGRGVTITTVGGSSELLPTRTVIWAAGVAAADVASALATRAGLGVDGAGRIDVLPDLSLPGHPEVLAIGDMVRVRQADGQVMALPGLAPVAMQQGRHAARVVQARVQGLPSEPFRYRDKGNLATIGRGHAVAEIRRLRLSGWGAWVAWLAVHLWYLIGFQNRLIVLIRWAFSFIRHGRGARLITGVPAPEPRDPPVAQLPVAPDRSRLGDRKRSDEWEVA